MKNEKILGPYKNLMVVSVRGIGYNWKQIVYCGFDARLTKELIHELIRTLYLAGIVVYSLVSDMSTINRRVWKELGIDIKNGKYSFPHPTSSHEIWTFADFPHAIKLLRNHFLDSDIKLGEDFNNEVISSKTLLKLVELQRESELKIAFKLTEKHFDLNNRERMKVRPAFELFSTTTAKAVQYLLPEHKQLASFIQLVNDACDIFNSRTKIRNTNPFKCPFGLELQEQKNVVEKFCKNILELRYQTRYQCIKPHQRGLELDCHSLFGLFEILSSPPISANYIVTKRLTQDYLESDFGGFRGIGGFNQTPMPLDSLYRIRSMIIQKNVTKPKTSNVHDENGTEFLTAAKLTAMSTQVQKQPYIYDAQYFMDKLGHINPNFPVQVPIYENVEGKAKFGASEMVAGMIARRFLEDCPELKCQRSREGWVKIISRGNLITPSSWWICTFLKFEEFFEAFHKQRYGFYLFQYFNNGNQF